MSLSEEFLLNEDLHPIDIVETLATHNDWEFDRVTDDQIAMAVEGQWRTYSLTLAWSAQDETLRLICTFEMEPPEEKIGALHDVLNRCNDMVWTGAFTWWAEQKLMVWRYGLCLAGGQIAGPEQIDRLIAGAVMASERFYPAFQMAALGRKDPGRGDADRHCRGLRPGLRAEIPDETGLVPLKGPSPSESPARAFANGLPNHRKPV
ncbi:hypothetical protein MASR1M32_12180 [Rhodobacter sp.]